MGTLRFTRPPVTPVLKQGGQGGRSDAGRKLSVSSRRRAHGERPDAGGELQVRGSCTPAGSPPWRSLSPRYGEMNGGSVSLPREVGRYIDVALDTGSQARAASFTRDSGFSTISAYAPPPLADPASAHAPGIHRTAVSARGERRAHIRLARVAQVHAEMAQDPFAVVDPEVLLEARPGFRGRQEIHRHTVRLLMTKG